MIAFIKLTGPDENYLLNVNNIIAIEDVKSVQGEYGDWVNTVLTVDEKGRTSQYMCQETVDEVEIKLNSLNNDKIRVI